MTDNEIIKALECCSDDELCNNCGFVYGDCNCGSYRVNLTQDALSLINRQKAEIDGLKIANEKMYEAGKEQEAEVERLQKHIQDGIDLAKQLPETLKLAQAEAIKEFAERLKHGWCADSYRCFDHIDNLVKEMVDD